MSFFHCQGVLHEQQLISTDKVYLFVRFMHVILHNRKYNTICILGQICFEKTLAVIFFLLAFFLFQVGLALDGRRGKMLRET